MMLRKLLWVAVALCVMAGVAFADPVRTLFVRENQFPGSMGWEASLAVGGSTFDAGSFANDKDDFFVAPGVRFGITDRLAVRAELPFNRVSVGSDNNSGLGDIALGMDFLFYEDIFRYAWIVPHATVLLPTGSEDKNLGYGKTRSQIGLSAGTTVQNVFHFGADVSYFMNGSLAEKDDDVLIGSLSLIGDLDEKASLLGEVQFRDDSNKPDDDYVLRGHVGMIYRINRSFTIMGYGGSSSGGLNQDFYGLGRLVFQF